MLCIDVMNGLEVAIWTGKQRAGFVGRLLSRMGAAVSVSAAGGPPDDRPDALMDELNVERTDDFRKMIVDCPATFVVLGSRMDVEMEDLVQAVTAGMTVLCLDLPFHSFDELRIIHNVKSLGEGGGLRLLPAFLGGAGWRRATDPRDAVGKVQSFSADICMDETTNSLALKLFDAWKTALRFVDLPESIDASIIGLMKDVPDSFTKITGMTQAHARIGPGCSAMINVRQWPGASRASIEVVGETGTLGVTREGYTLHGPDGQEMDAAGDDATPVNDAAFAGDQWQRFIDSGPEADALDAIRGTATDAAALACCLTCHLSARTTQAENPRNIMNMHGWNG